MFVGFPRNKRVIDGYARCLLCRVDLSIAGRGLSNLWDHWRGNEHTRLEQKYRIMTQKPLLDKSCRPVSAAEDKRIRLERMAEPPVYLESPLDLTVDERVAIEREEEERGALPVVAEQSVTFLWLCCVINALINTTSIDRVMRFVEMWADSLCTELDFVTRRLDYQQYQVLKIFCFLLSWL